jgi:hypothetical protein
MNVSDFPEGAQVLFYGSLLQKTGNITCKDILGNYSTLYLRSSPKCLTQVITFDFLIKPLIKLQI